MAWSFPDAAPLLQNLTGLRLLLDHRPAAVKGLFPVNVSNPVIQFIDDFQSHLESSVNWGNASPYFKFAV